jgi:hypothetical protein
MLPAMGILVCSAGKLPRQWQHCARGDETRGDGRGGALVAARNGDEVGELRFHALHRSVPDAGYEEQNIQRRREGQSAYWLTDSVESAALLLVFWAAAVLAVRADGSRPWG